MAIYEPGTKLPVSSHFPILQFAPVIKRGEEVGRRLRVIQSTTEIDREMIHQVWLFPFSEWSLTGLGLEWPFHDFHKSAQIQYVACPHCLPLKFIKWNSQVENVNLRTSMTRYDSTARNVFCLLSFLYFHYCNQGSTDQNRSVKDQAVRSAPRTPPGKLRNLGPDQDLQKFENLGPIRTGRWIHGRNEKVSKFDNN